MNALDKFVQSFGFTQNERRVILFLVVTFLAGGIIKLYRSSHPVQQQFNYTSSDSEFAARSALAEQPDSILEQSTSSSSVERRPVSKTHASKKININTASAVELTKLPGIGEAMAKKIIAYRNEHGNLKTVEELMNVKGIGKKKFERLAPLLTVEKK